MEKINPIQAMIDGMSASWQKERAATQMTLGGLIDALKVIPPDAKVTGFGAEMSYRGYYSDLAFEPTDAVKTVAELLAQCQGAMGQVYEGYKGGDYQMGATTPVFIAHYGETGPRLMGLIVDGLISPITEPEED